MIVRDCQRSIRVTAILSNSEFAEPLIVKQKSKHALQKIIRVSRESKQDSHTFSIKAVHATYKINNSVHANPKSVHANC